MTSSCIKKLQEEREKRKEALCKQQLPPAPKYLIKWPQKKCFQWVLFTWLDVWRLWCFIIIIIIFCFSLCVSFYLSRLKMQTPVPALLFSVLLLLSFDEFILVLNRNLKKRLNKRGNMLNKGRLWRSNWNQLYFKRLLHKILSFKLLIVHIH